MPFSQAALLALQAAWSHKLRSFFTLLGIIVSVAFLIAVVAIIQGMNAYVRERIGGAIVGANAFQVRRRAKFNNDAEVLPGAVLAGLLFQSLQSFGYLLVRHVIKNASETNAVFALVLGMLAYLFVASVVVVISMEVNVVRVEKLWPRSLLTPFTDAVELTEADETTYTRQAKVGALKGFETIDVDFTKEPEDEPRDAQ